MTGLVGFIFWILLQLTTSLPQASPPIDQVEDCSTYSSAGYHCVPYFQCSKNGSVIQDGSNIFDPRDAEIPECVDGAVVSTSVGSCNCGDKFCGAGSTCTRDGGVRLRCVPPAEVFCPEHQTTLQTACDELLEVCCLHPIVEKIRRCQNDATDDEDDYVYDDYYEDYEDEDDEIPKSEGGCPNQDIKFDIREDREKSYECNKTVKCEDYKYQGYSCAPYYQCLGKDRNPISDEKSIKSDGFGIIDLRSSDRSGCDSTEDCVSTDDINATLDASDDKCPGENQVCCKNPDTNKELCSASGANKCNKDKYGECGRINSGNKRDTRGVTITNLNSKVTRPAQPGEFPHMCIIYRISNGATQYVGGASLLARNKVLSVAHKFHVISKSGRGNVDLRGDIQSLSVRCGEYNVKLETEVLKAQESQVEELYFHPQYQPENQFVPNDLVILRTKQNFIYQEHIGPVCLPRPDENFEDSVDSCWSSGWGADQFGKVGKFQDILKKVGMNVIPDEECNQKFSSTRLRNKYKVDKSHLCVGGEPGIDTCTGDGGSPHVCRREGKWVQVGAVAWGIGCNDGIPAVYSSVSDAMCWIDWVMTCQSLAANDISFNQDPDSERSGGDQLNSINKLTHQECGTWAAANRELTNNCEVIYYGSDEEDDYDYDVRLIDE